MTQAPVKPTVMVGYAPHPDDTAKLREVAAGLEEEGIPYTIKPVDEADTVAIAYAAACASPLGVGLGIREREMCIHYYRLPETKPLFLSTGGNGPAVWRWFGYNAARLVKGTPFKPQPDVQTAPSGVAEPDSAAELKDMIVRTIYKVLQEQITPPRP
ncbi:glycerol dehydratase reactivase beta/small subunit family protein [Sporolituus thermophilus]|uniref:Dehydratase medium subunit n=1 Tax=Sporolituus thermophilus DSM 23256 TaxID=1123285 RepID=A0A1G7M471_9FIRM|nr:glycerol dehydratase reactivase beta/small subunit family protein [Sporolituus thermophilus]SDF56426.1 Dehydratase medium subunit [Sporolituus thermophilus DSM 23256]